METQPFSHSDSKKDPHHLHTYNPNRSLILRPAPVGAGPALPLPVGTGSGLQMWPMEQTQLSAQASQSALWSRRTKEHAELSRRQYRHELVHSSMDSGSGHDW